MGRRALRKIDPLLDLSKHLFEVEKMPIPLAPSSLFSAGAPLEIEVGSGKGLFMTSASGARSEHNFLGVEIARKYAQYCAARLARSGRSNAVMLYGDARRLFAEILPAACAVAVHVYFPDPWWKNRHLRRRLLDE